MDLHTLNIEWFRLWGAGFAAHPACLALARGVAADSVLLLPVLLLALWWWRPGDRNHLLAAAASGFLALARSEAVSALIPTPRPFMLNLSPAYLPHPADGSFPSAHASLILGVSAGLFLVPGKRLRPWGAGLGAVGIATGWARIYLGLHVPLDILGAAGVAGVAAGLLTGFGTGWTADLRRILEQLEARLAPVLPPLRRKTGQNGRT
jgi:undecaprenyl-diphosphatase